MAVVKVKSVKTGLAKTIRYVINPAKYGTAACVGRASSVS